MRMYDDIKRSENVEQMAALLCDITWVCGDCSPDSKEQCKECLSSLLTQSAEDIVNG